MSRIVAREHTFKMLFQKGFNMDEDINEQISIYFESFEDYMTKNLTDLDKEFINNELKGILENLKKIDQCIEKAARGWKVSRMSKVDLTILRLAVYEIKFVSDIPINVSINEAVNLAKKFSSKSASAFINGVLGQIVTDES